MSSLTDSSNIPCTAHPQSLTRLRCTECETPICPKCMVMYEVGFKCPGCAKKRPSHVAQVEPRHWLTVGIAGIGLGLGYGWLHPWLMAIGVLRIFGLPVLAFLLAYGLGKSLGGLAHRLAGHKINRKLSACVVLCALVGAALALPLQTEVMAILEVVGSTSNNPYLSGTSSDFFMLGPALRLLGLLFFVQGLYRAFQI